MRRGLLALAFLVASTGCGNLCPAVPLPINVAVHVRVTAAGTSGPVQGVYLVTSGTVQMPKTDCTAQADASVCEVFGGPGTYDLVIGAPDYQSVQRSVTVVCKDVSACGCTAFDAQTLEVSLSR